MLALLAQRQLYFILFIVFIGFVGNSIAYPIFAPLFLQSHFPGFITDTWGQQWHSLLLGATLMMYPLGQFIGSPILGALSDCWGRKKLFVISIGIVALLYVLTGLSLDKNRLWGLIACRFLTGCAEGSLTLARAMAVDLTELNKHKSLGLINAMGALGYVLGPLLGGFLSDKHLISWFNYSTPFYFSSIISLFLMLMAIAFLRENVKNSSRRVVGFMQQINIRERLKRMSQNKTLKMLLIACTLASLGQDLFYEFYPAYMSRLWGATPTMIAWVTAVLSIAMFVGSGWLSHSLSTRFTSSRIIVFCLVLIAMLLSAMLFFPPRWVVVILFIIIGFAIALTTTNYTVQISDSAGSDMQGEVFGALYGLRMLLDGIAAIVGGALMLITYASPIALAAFASLLSGWFYCKYCVVTTPHPNYTSERP